MSFASWANMHRSTGSREGSAVYKQEFEPDFTGRFKGEWDETDRRICNQEITVRNLANAHFQQTMPCGVRDIEFNGLDVAFTVVNARDSL